MMPRAVLGSLLGLALTPLAASAFTLRSPAFADGAPIPTRYTCEGADVSPPLAWQAAPAGTQGFVLVVDDPDAPDPAAPRATPWVHWVLYDLPASTSALAEGVTGDALPPGTRAGRNDGGRSAYHGPCPPIGRHRYRFQLHALDTTLPDLDTAVPTRLDAALRGHVLDTAVLVGTYQKSDAARAPR